MSQPALLRTIKYRSLENQKYDTVYNRLTFNIPQDMLSTDMSQSYINFKLRVMAKNTKEAITTEELAKMTANDIAIGFGFEDNVYSPACLVQSCVLKKGSDGSIIETIPFSNIISQTMFQLTQNKDTIMNNNIFNGIALETKEFYGETSNLIKNPIEVKIMLSELFQICKNNTNFWLSETKGLIIELVLEDKKSIMKLNRVDGSLLTIEDSADNTNNRNIFPNSVESNRLQSFQSGKFQNIVEGDETLIGVAKSRVMFSQHNSTLFHFTPDTTKPATDIPRNQELILKAEYDNANAELLKENIKVNSNVKMMFRLKTTTGNIPKLFTMLNKITEIIDKTAGTPATPALLTYNNIGGKTPAVAPAEWATQAGYYLTGGAVSTDFSCDVAIDATTGNYSINNVVFDLTKAYTTGAKYIVPANKMGGSPAVGTGVANVEDLEITINANSAVGATPTFTVGGRRNPPPTPTPAVPASPAKIVFKNSWYADNALDLEYQGFFVVDGVVNEKTIDAELRDNMRKNIMVFTKAEMEVLKTNGVVVGEADVFLPTEATFNLGVQVAHKQSYPVPANDPTTQAEMITNFKHNIIAPEMFKQNKVNSNGFVKLPNSGKKVKIQFIKTLPADLFEVEFSDLNMSVDFGFQFQGIHRLTPTSDYILNSSDAEKLDVIFDDIVKPKSLFHEVELDLFNKVKGGITYEIDLAELVLVQESKNKKMPMGSVFSTYHIEPFTIEGTNYSYERQMNVSEPNCYNIALLTPDNSDSLISGGRNIYQYRYQINNIANTSNDIELKTLSSDYPSSLHMDKMLEYFGNSTSKLMNFFGINGLENSAHPVSLLPMKVYTASDPSNYYSNPRGFTVQLAIHADKSKAPLKSGTCYFLKSVIKSL